MTRNNHDWRRVSRRRRCPVCSKADWCLYVGPAEAPKAAICARTESPKRCGEAGWLHELRNDGPTWPRWRQTIRRAVRMMGEGKPNGIDFDGLAAACQKAAKPQALGRLAGSLGVSVESLRRLSVGWSKEHSAWTFPMKNADGQVVGVRLRLPSGRKLAVRGGEEGLFIASGLQPGGQLLVAEGPSDVAALLDLKFSAVGRPSCTGGVRLVVKFVKQRQPPEVVIVADADGDEAGQRGAERLASTLAAYVPAVRVVTPPNGINDARAWKRSGATAADVQTAIDAAPVRRLEVSAKRKAGRCKTTTA